MTALDLQALIERHQLTYVGETSNTVVYATSDHLLIAIPHEGARDDGASAKENAGMQEAYFQAQGHKGGVAIFFDRMASQDREARHRYQELDHVLSATALIGGSMLSRALASFFFSIVKPKTPLRLFPELEPALAWLRQINDTHDLTLGTRPEP